MNEINFEIQDIEKIDLSMDVGIKKVYPPIENLEVMPTKEQQVFTHENSYGYDNVTINPIPDEYIIPDGTLPITENATYDVRKFARVSTSVHPAPNLQDKELTINENGTHTITADEEYDGLNQVSVTVDAIEDLSEELETYNEELTEQEATITTIIETLQNKASKEIKLQDKEIAITENGTQSVFPDNDYDGLGKVDVTVNVESTGAGGCLGQPSPILSMNVSTINNGVAKKDTTDIIALYNWSSSITMDTNPNIALVFWFVRSNYTISDNVTVIYESEPFMEPNGTPQYLCVGYMNYVNGETITLTQETSDRIGLGYLPLCNCGIPTVVNSTYISNDSDSDIPINTDEYLNIYIINSTYTISLRHNLNTMSNGQIVSNAGWYSRLGYLISTNPIQDAKIRHQAKFYGNIVQVRLPAKVYE